MANEPQKDLVVEARGLLAKITPGKWGYDLNGHVAVIEDDNEWGQTLFLIPGKTTPQMTSEDHANGELFARAPELLRQLCDEVERLRKQWNTRFNTLCGLCGKRYLGPRDEHLHGYGRCDKKVDHAD